MSLCIVTPSRGRPERMAYMAAAAHHFARGPVEIRCYVDDDDPTVDEYRKIPGIELTVGPRGGLNELTNRAALDALEWDHLASLGDDHLPMTEAWDVLLCAAASPVGISYGNDQLAGEALPTAAVLSSSIVEALGYMAPPEMEHLYIDNFWRDLGDAAGCLAYLQDVVVRHDHPNAGRANWDDTYQAGNATSDRDRVAYEQYRASRFADDVAKVRRLVDAWIG